MIDEPEISLHPIWLTELKEIITTCMEYSKRQVIICTHSPELVYLFEDAIPVENFSKIEE
jgi:predicted ATPase